MIANCVVERVRSVPSCPCCGAPAALIRTPYWERPAGAGTSYAVECLNTDCGIRTPEQRSAARAIWIWSRRI